MFTYRDERSFSFQSNRIVNQVSYAASNRVVNQVMWQKCLIDVRFRNVL